jgi:hypothetical protein
MRAVFLVVKDCLLQMAISTCRRMSSRPSCSSTHHHQSLFPTSGEWTSHHNTSTHVVPSQKVHDPLLPLVSWLPNYCISGLHIYVHAFFFPNAIHFTLKMEAAKSLEMLVYYHNITWHHNPEDDLNLHLCSYSRFCNISSLFSHDTMKESISEKKEN